MGCMVYGDVWLYYHTALYGAVLGCMGLYGCMAPGGRRDEACKMYGAIQLYGGLYGVPAVWHYIQHASQVLYHTHVADLPDTHSHTHTQLLACNWKLVWALLKPRPPGA